MKKIIFAAIIFTFGLAMFLVSLEPHRAMAGSGNCYNCGSGSKDGINQCRYYGSDTSEQRRKCKDAGCDITGTASCSTASNVKVIDPNG